MSDIREKIEAALRNYTCQHSCIDDEGAPLVDMLTPLGDSTIERGAEEIELLADYLAVELESA